LKATWVAMIPLKSGESVRQVERFFNSIAGLISIQIRHLLQDWILKWESLILSYQVSGVNI